MTLSRLKAELREGKRPEDIGGENIGSGYYKAAYAVGPFVVKADTDDTLRQKHFYHADVRKAGGRMAPTLCVEGWQIQLRYAPMTAEVWVKHWPKFLTIGDIHNKNVGLDRRGKVVAFDW